MMWDSFTRRQWKKEYAAEAHVGAVAQLHVLVHTDSKLLWALNPLPLVPCTHPSLPSPFDPSIL